MNRLMKPPLPFLRRFFREDKGKDLNNHWVRGFSGPGCLKLPPDKEVVTPGRKQTELFSTLRLQRFLLPAFSVSLAAGWDSSSGFGDTGAWGRGN